MQHNQHARLIGLTLTGLCLLPLTVNASELIESNGGLKYGSKENPHWFEIGGVLKLDQTLFKGGKRNDFHSGANIRSLGLDFDGGIGKDYTYTIGLSYDASAKSTSVEDLYLSYHGLAENTQVSIGQVYPGFSLTNTSSSKWVPFREKSMSDVAFAPDPGLGISGKHWDDNYTITVAITQPKSTDTVKQNNGTEVKRSDRWQTSARLTYAPIHEENRVLQLGVSGHLQDDSSNEISFSTAPEAKSRNFTKVLNTQTGTEGIVAKSHSTLDLELAGKYDSLKGEIEYTRAHVRRGVQFGQAVKGPNLNFHGYHVQASYLLTGETYPFKSSSGTFGKVVPNSSSGAWEASARYSFINLVDEDICGGSAHNSTVALSWYANNNIRVIGEYVHSKMHEYRTLAKRTLHIFGMRLQAVF